MHYFRLYLNSFSGMSREIWFLALVTFVNRAGTMVVPFLSIYLKKSQHFSYSEVGWIMSAFGLGSMAGAWLGSHTALKFGARLIRPLLVVISLCLTGRLLWGYFAG